MHSVEKTVYVQLSTLVWAACDYSVAFLLCFTGLQDIFYIHVQLSGLELDQ